MVELRQFSEAKIKTPIKKIKKKGNTKDQGSCLQVRVQYQLHKYQMGDFQLLCALNTNRNLEIKCQQMKAKH